MQFFFNRELRLQKLRVILYLDWMKLSNFVLNLHRHIIFCFSHPLHQSLPTHLQLTVDSLPWINHLLLNPPNLFNNSSMVLLFSPTSFVLESSTFVPPNALCVGESHQQRMMFDELWASTNTSAT
jgi:hypothetical protein